MMDIATNFPIAFGIIFVAVWLLREMHKFGVDRKTQNQIEDLWNWHNKEDEDGAKIWYVKKGLQTAIEKLGDNVEKQTTLLQQMFNELKSLQSDVRRKDVK